MKAYFLRLPAKVFFVIPLLHPKLRRQSSNPLRHCCMQTFSTSLVEWILHVCCVIAHEKAVQHGNTFFSLNLLWLRVCERNEWKCFDELYAFEREKLLRSFLSWPSERAYSTRLGKKKENANELCYTNCQVHSFWYARERVLVGFVSGFNIESFCFLLKIALSWKDIISVLSPIGICVQNDMRRWCSFQREFVFIVDHVEIRNGRCRRDIVIWFFMPFFLSQTRFYSYRFVALKLWQ